MSAQQIIFASAAVGVALALVLAAPMWRKRRDPVLRALRELRDRRGGSRFRTLEDEKDWVMAQTGLGGDELAAKLDAIVIWDPVDESEPLPRSISLEDLPPGKERAEAERLLGELRKRREREVPSEARKARAGRNESEIRAAGDRIDLPFIAPTPLKPGEGIRYSDGKTLAEVHREHFPGFYEQHADTEDEAQADTPS